MKYVYLILPFLLLSSCTKENSCQDCLETFRCKINGEKWEPNCGNSSVGWCEDIDCQYYIENGALDLYIISQEANGRLRFSARNIFRRDTAFIHYGNREYKDFSRGNCASYDLIQELPNYVELFALDTIDYTVEGNFAFSVLGRCDGDTLHITDGYFHLAYRF